MSKFRKKPVVIEAMQWNPGDLAQAGLVVGWLMANGVDFHHPSGMGDTTTLALPTMEGEMLARPGWWVIRGVAGEFYACEPEIFAATYEPADELPGWDDLTDLDKGAALMHLHKREWEGPEYAESDYPCRYFDHPALTVLGTLEASRHAAGMAHEAADLAPGEHDRLYDAALDADRARMAARREAAQ